MTIRSSSLKNSSSFESIKWKFWLALITLQSGHSSFLLFQSVMQLSQNSCMQGSTVFFLLKKHIGHKLSSIFSVSLWILNASENLYSSESKFSTSICLISSSFSSISDWFSSQNEIHIAYFYSFFAKFSRQKTRGKSSFQNLWKKFKHSRTF